MKISTKGRYGLRAMHYLALHSKDGPVSLSAISNEEDISLSYLEQLMRKLRIDGFVVSVRGAKGGYVLAKEPSEISVGDILRSLEGQINLTDCLEEACGKGDDCAARILWGRINKGIREVVDHTTLAELTGHENKEEVK